MNAQHDQAGPGRKPDVKDWAWLAELLELGLRRASFIPPPPIRERRERTRSRTTRIQERAHELNRVHKRLESAHINLGLVAPDLLGASGRALWRALVAGARDGAVLAERATGVRRQKRGRLAAALQGRFTAHHAMVLGEWLAQIECLKATSARLRERMAVALEPYQEPVEHVQGIPGVNQQAAEMLRAEIGVEMSRFPSAAHVASWAGVGPGTHESAGTRKTGNTRQGNPWLKTLLVEGGWAAGRARRTYLGAQYARLGRRRGKKRAALAVGHRLLVAAYHMVRDGVPYQDLGPEHVDRLATDRLVRHDVRRLEQLGHHVTRGGGTGVA